MDVLRGLGVRAQLGGHYRKTRTGNMNSFFFSEIRVLFQMKFPELKESRSNFLPEGSLRL